MWRRCMNTRWRSKAGSQLDIEHRPAHCHRRSRSSLSSPFVRDEGVRHAYLLPIAHRDADNANVFVSVVGADPYGLSEQYI
jgi:hypothetical protein